MDRNTLQERRKHFLAFVTALVIVFTMLPMWTDAYGDDGSGSGSDEPACEHKNTILIPYEDQEATCVEGCLGYKFCNDCEQRIAEEVEIPIDPNNHVGSKVPAGNAKDATCVAEGYTGDILCDECNKVWEKGSKIPINLNNHVGSEKSAGNAKEATCVEEGYTGDILCDECNNVWEKGEEIPIDKTKHAGPIVDAGNAKEASCTEEGYTGDKKCQACGTVTEQGKAIAKKAHELDDGTVTKEATCSATGVRTYKCKNCEYTETEEIPINKDAHDWDDGVVTKEPTCSATGEKLYTCKLNSSHTKTEVIPADKSKHTAGETKKENIKLPTCTVKGSHEENVYCKYCNVAMFVKSVIDEALGHKLVHHPAKDATVDVEGNKEYWECTVCGKIFIDQDGKTETSLQEVTIPKLSEDPEEGKKTLVHVDDFINQNNDHINLKNDLIYLKNDHINLKNDLINQKNDLINNQKNDLINQNIN